MTKKICWKSNRILLGPIFIEIYFLWHQRSTTTGQVKTGRDQSDDWLTGRDKMTDGGTGQDWLWRRGGWLDDWRDDETRQTAKEKIKNIFCNEFVFFLKITINITSEKRLTTDWLCRLPTDDFWLDYALPWLTTTSLADWTKNNEIKIRRNDCEIYCDADFWEVCFLNDKKNIFQN